MPNFKDVFSNGLEKCSKYYLSSGKYDIMPKICKEHLEPHSNVAVLAIGKLLDDIHYLRKSTDGNIALVDMDNSYPYELVSRATGDVFLPEEPEYYKTAAGLNDINNLFSEAGVTCFVEQFPPLPEGIPDSSIDAVFVMSLFATPTVNKRFSDGFQFYEELIDSIDKKLAPGGKLIAEEAFGLDLLYTFMYVLTQNKPDFKWLGENTDRMSCWSVFQKPKK